MVVKEAEVAFDAFQVELLEGEHDTEKHEVKVHYRLMQALHVDNSESEGGDGDQQD